MYVHVCLTSEVLWVIYFNKFAGAALHNYHIYGHQIPADIANGAKQSIYKNKIVIEFPAPLIPLTRVSGLHRELY